MKTTETLTSLGEVITLNNLKIMFGVANDLDLPLDYLVECSVRKFGSEAVRDSIKAALAPHRKMHATLTAALGCVENPRTIGAAEYDAWDGTPKPKDEPLAYDDRLSLAKRVFVN